MATFILTDGGLAKLVPGVRGTTIGKDVLGRPAVKTVPASELLAAKHVAPDAANTLTWATTGGVTGTTTRGATLGSRAWSFSPSSDTATAMSTIPDRNWQPLRVTETQETNEVNITLHGVFQLGTPRQLKVAVDWASDTGFVTRTYTGAITLTGTGQNISYNFPVPQNQAITRFNLALVQNEAPLPLKGDVLIVGDVQASTATMRLKPTTGNGTGPGTGTPGTGTGTGTGTATGSYRTDSWHIIDPNGKGFIPKGFNVGGYNNNGGYDESAHLNPTTLQHWKSLGVNIVRVTVNPTTVKSWGWMNNAKAWNGKYGLAGMADYLNTLVSTYRQAGLITMIEWHDFTDGGFSAAQVTQAAQAWTQTANQFKNQTDVWFNTANEPAVTGQAWTDFQMQMVKAIRDTGATNIVILDAPLGGTDGATNGKARDLAKPVRTAYPGNLILSQHNYAWGNDGKPLGNTTNYREWALANQAAGWPTLHGEIGSTTPPDQLGPGTTALHLQGINASLTVGTELKIGSLWWAVAFNDKFNIYSGTSEVTPATSGRTKTEAGAKFLSYLATAPSTYDLPAGVGGSTGGSSGGTTNPGTGTGTNPGTGTGTNPGTGTGTGTPPAAGGSTQPLMLSNFVAVTKDPAGKRNPLWEPYHEHSPFNLPIVQNATFGSVPPSGVLSPGGGANGRGDGKTTAAHVTINYDRYSHAVYIAPAGTPEVSCIDVGPGHGNASMPFPIPTQTQAAAGTDGNWQVCRINTDGTVTMQEMWQAVRQNNGAIHSQRIERSNWNGMGAGPKNGIRAGGTSGPTGLIRECEIAKTSPRYKADPQRPDAPVINHPLALAGDEFQTMWGNRALWQQLGSRVGPWYADNSVTDQTSQPGHKPGQPRYWFCTQLGYRWPAGEQDVGTLAYEWPAKYNGNAAMGSYWALPPSVDIMSLGLNWAQFAIARALQDYGAYFIDKSNGTTFYVEYNGAGRMHADMAAFMGSFPWNSATGNNKLVALVGALREVKSTYDAPNGGPITAPRRQPIKAPLGLLNPDGTLR